MRAAASVLLLLVLAGCGCAPEKGDKTIGEDTIGYISGCWAYAKGQDK